MSQSQHSGVCEVDYSGIGFVTEAHRFHCLRSILADDKLKDKVSGCYLIGAGSEIPPELECHLSGIAKAIADLALKGCFPVPVKFEVIPEADGKLSYFYTLWLISKAAATPVESRALWLRWTKRLKIFFQQVMERFAAELVKKAATAKLN